MSPPLRSSRTRDPKRRILAVGPKTSRTAARIASTSRGSNRMPRVYSRAVGWAQDNDGEHGGGLARGPGGPPPDPLTGGVLHSISLSPTGGEGPGEGETQ